MAHTHEYVPFDTVAWICSGGEKPCGHITKKDPNPGPHPLKIAVRVNVEPLSENEILAFHETMGIANLDGYSFEVSRSLSGMHLAFHGKKEDRPVIYTLDLAPIIQASIEAIIVEETT